MLPGCSAHAVAIFEAVFQWSFSSRNFGLWGLWGLKSLNTRIKTQREFFRIPKCSPFVLSLLCFNIQGGNTMVRHLQTVTFWTRDTLTLLWDQNKCCTWELSPIYFALENSFYVLLFLSLWIISKSIKGERWPGRRKTHTDKKQTYVQLKNEGDKKQITEVTIHTTSTPLNRTRNIFCLFTLHDVIQPSRRSVWSVFD